METFIRQTRSIDDPDELEGEMKAGIHDIVNRRANKVKHASIFTHDEQVKMLDECRELAKEAKMLNIFDDVWKVLAALADQPKGSIRAYASQAWAVT
mgnify:FL=1